jgi:hypothetical protein
VAVGGDLAPCEDEHHRMLPEDTGLILWTLSVRLEWVVRCAKMSIIKCRVRGLNGFDGLRFLGRLDGVSQNAAQRCA